MCSQKRRPQSPLGPGVGERSEPELGPAHRRRRNTASLHDASRAHYTPEERRAAIEAYQMSGLSLQAFGRTWGVSGESLYLWLKAYREHGPKGLEHPHGNGRRGRKPLAVSVREEIVAVKRRFPDFGFRRVRDFLARFHGLRVSTGGVRSAVKAAALPPTVLPKRRGRRHEIVRRFERSRAGELWQSDITSFVLARESRRVYLIVFLDDFSRYVVAFGLHVHQRQDIATEALLEGIARFGKPKEVLTDQGRQYYAWRGKSEFQRLLDKEGIRHVVSRAHHPETLGKCERLWETIGKELWDRAHPKDLADARERLSHYFRHYNHYRPHQGIGGLVPADRFFGADSTIRKTLEAAMIQNEIRLALGERPRKPVFLVGQIGDQQVSLIGERGRLVVQTPGREEAIHFEEIGTQGVSDDDGRKDADDERGCAHDTSGARVQKAATVHPGAEAGLSDPLPVGSGERGGEEPSARAVRDALGVLARGDDEAGDLEAARGAADPSVAAESASGGGDGVRTSAPAEKTRQAECGERRPAERPGDAEEADHEARATDRVAGPTDRGPEDPALQPGPGASATTEGRGRGDGEERRCGEEAPSGASFETRSDRGSAKPADDGVSEETSPWLWG